MIKGGVLDRDAAGNKSEFMAAEDVDENADKVRERSGFWRPLMSREGPGTGKVAIECNDDCEVFRVGLRSWSSDTSVGERRVRDLTMYDGDAKGLPTVFTLLGGDEDR